IMIDQASLDYMANESSLCWPWPREIYAPVIQFLTRGGAAALAFDMIFSETSCSQVADDEAFAAAVKGPLPIVIPVVLRNATTLEAEPLIEHFRAHQRALA